LQQRLAALGHGIPVILMTADRDRGIRARAERLGAVAVLSKPHDGALLLTAVAKALLEARGIR
jgi:FixJ family two-component response regulator